MFQNKKGASIMVSKSWDADLKLTQVLPEQFEQLTQFYRSAIDHTA